MLFFKVDKKAVPLIMKSKNPSDLQLKLGEHFSKLKKKGVMCMALQMIDRIVII